MSVGHAKQPLTVVHLDDHAAHTELPAADLEAADDRLRVLVADTLEATLSLLESEAIDCLVASLGGEGYDRPEDITARAREVVPDLPIVFFDACEPDAVVDALDTETSFVPRIGTPESDGGTATVAGSGAAGATATDGNPGSPSGAYALLANRIESLVPRRRDPSVFDPVADELATLLNASTVPACVFRGEAVTYHNKAFADAFGVGSPPIREDRVFDAVVEGEGDLRSLCTPPSSGSASGAIERPDGEQRRVKVTAASDGGAVLALWVNPTGGDPDRPSREESMLRSLLDDIPVSVYFKDQQSRHVKVSDAQIGMSAEEYLVNDEGKRHPTSEDVVGKTDFDLYHGDHASLTVEDDRQVMETERPIDLKEEYTHSDTGEDIWVLTCKAPWYGPDGEVAGVAGITVDVTEQKHNLREESPLDGRLEQFERVLTTTLREELQRAIETVERARDADVSNGPSNVQTAGNASTDASEEPLDAVADHLDVLDGLLADVMTLARYTRTPSERSSIELRDMLQTVWDDLDAEHGELAIEADPILFADEEQLHCLLRNLLQVAVGHGGTGVRIEVGQLEEGFYVERSGAPLTPQERDALMEGRVDDASASLGLAMTIVVSIADANGWNATVSSGGRRFEFTDVDIR
ncbi:PAS domain-containing sensor histidine kinase [Salinarchaeum laminariae]|uniref:PAS domain-containing sensor histidine kinase n=1 Tax=Salinarchaeum laminariae TaxID=869888 RepID=UPI0020C0F534|nr:PAS domain-containing protein [Salinarchaeum laminariae]